MLGNWDNWKQDLNGDGAYTAKQESEDRTHNAANEITSLDIQGLAGSAGWHRTRATDLCSERSVHPPAVSGRLAGVALQSPHRKRMRRREIPGGVRFITGSCQRRLPRLGNPAICRIFLETMARARARFSLEIFAWVLMPEHTHLLLRPPEHGELAPAIKSLKLSVSMRLIARWREIPILARITDGPGRPRFWQKGGGFDRNVRDKHEFRHPRDKQGAVYSQESRGAGPGGAAGGLAMVERALVDGASGRGVPVRPAPRRPRHVGGMGGVQMRVRLIRHRSTDLSKQRSVARVRCHPAWSYEELLHGYV